MFVGEIILESLNSSQFLDQFQEYLIISRQVEMKNEEPPICNIKRYQLPLFQLEKIIPQIEKENLKSGWYVHFYSDSSNEMYVILPKQTFQLPKYKNETWDAMISYGEKFGVERRWTENIPVDFKSEINE